YLPPQPPEPMDTNERPPQSGTLPRFRVFDPELGRMLYSDSQEDADAWGARLGQSLVGTFFAAFYGLRHIMEPTGLTDAEGREVWEGDVLEGEPWSFADPDPLRCIVRREAWTFVLENDPA